MSLVGNLADLGLGDIFQIVALSRRSGRLQITTPVDAGEIAFASGSVVGAFMASATQTVGEQLLERQLVTPVQLQEMMQAESGGVLGAALFAQFHLEPQAVQDAFEIMLKPLIYSMFDWNVGTFSFALGDQNDLWNAFSLKGSRAVVERGLNTQFLMMESARLRDERAQGDDLESFLAAPSASAPQAAKTTPPPEPVAAYAQQVAKVAQELKPPEQAKPCTNLVVIDDDAATLRWLQRTMAPGFEHVEPAGSVEVALDAIKRFHPDVAVACDLVMARSDGHGILGGLEVLEETRKLGADIALLLFSDYENQEAERRAKQLDVLAFLRKPRKQQLVEAIGAPVGGTAEADAFLHALRLGLGPVSQFASDADKPLQSPPEVAQESPRGVTEDHSETINIADELADEVDGLDFGDEGLAQEPVPEADARMSALRAMLAELADPANRDTITLLVLRFAGEFAERAALFLAAKGAFIGLGGFSADMAPEEFLRKVRSARIPVDEESVFSRVMRFESMVRGPLTDAPGNQRLLQALGTGWHQSTVLALPLISNGRVAAILFADNPSRKPLGPSDGLEIFVQQAGIAMDRMFLERRLEEARRDKKI